jgi:cyclopropane fatty-acyl-phospholipid synthase-like methyltransferase
LKGEAGLKTPYDRIAEAWHAGPRAFTAKKYVDLLAGELEPGASVLDLGCGTGEPVARYLVEKGFRVLGVDESAAMLEIARRVVPEAEFIRADMCELELEERFAAAVAWDSLFHVERGRHHAVLQKLSALLSPGGRLLLSAGGTGHAGFTSEMHGHRFFYSAHDPAETLRLLASAGFEVELCEEDDPSSKGHIAVVARKAVGPLAR